MKEEMVFNTTDRATALVLGVGPGLGRSVVQAFRATGFDVTAVARSTASLEGLEHSTPGRGSVTTAIADVTNDEAVTRLVAEARSASGHLDVLIYNAAVVRPDKPGELSAVEHRERLDINAFAAQRAATTVLASRSRDRRTTVLVTGGMPLPKFEYTSLSVGKAALRTIVHLLDQAHSSDLVRIGMVTPDGPIEKGTSLDPDQLAAQYVAFHAAPVRPWNVEKVVS